MLGSYNSNPGDIHLKLAFQILKYLRGPPDYLKIKVPEKDPKMLTVNIYSNASFATNPNNLKLFSGYLQKIVGNILV